MYVCGPTVYDYLHVGNARTMVIFDTVRRYLEYIDYEVSYVQNFTDIDDKIIARGDVSEKFLEEALTDMKGLNLLMGKTKNPRVTEEMEEIIEMIDVLIKKGNAYEVNGDVYFHVPSYEGYGALKKQDEHVSRLEENSLKKHSSDFALWKNAREGEPSFESPWGQGRPGWHIECSAMAKKYLGKTIDIHAGGIDLLFPHHENEIAQSCCANDADFANFFMHNEFVNINEEKMSKSLGNFFTIRDVAERYSYEIIRFFLLSSHYGSKMNFSDEAMKAASAGYERIRNCIEADGKNEEDFSEYRRRFEEAMEDDFNTANAIAIIFELVSAVNKLDARPSLVIELCEILGINFKFSEYKASINEMDIKDFIEQREQAKKNKDFALADKIRNDLKEQGITLIDTREGTKYKYES